ncbi:sulfurtransferase complex subunit TusC [Shewanella surugensis]|uniref:Sulfurtransferase complex subunit TusC n=1 Tax=Shewanella surugensis TaxID=212020 RepID=A0ABT0L9Q7_9GAMM|nr:sulfurtransferase complex subunit TusC [Shewanella surugensis]MCL1124444.1 sulfurtransferase complex subunit TusC [Shewanella surugensis]
MKKVTIIFRRGPHDNAAGREGLDLALLSASYEQEVSLVFTADGLFNLLSNQAPERIGCKDYIATFKALPLYDIDSVFVCQDAMQALGLVPEDFIIPITLCAADVIQQQLQSADQVWVF